MSRRKKVTIQDIAQELHVSFATVSNALGYKKGVSDEVRASVFAKAQELGYKIKPPKHPNGVPFTTGAAGWYDHAGVTQPALGTIPAPAPTALAAAPLTGSLASPLAGPLAGQLASPLGAEMAGFAGQDHSLASPLRIAVFLDSFFVQEIPSFYMEIYKNLVQYGSAVHYVANLIPVQHNIPIELLDSLNNQPYHAAIIIGQLAPEILANLKRIFAVPFVALDHYNDLDQDLHYIGLDSFVGMHSLVKNVLHRGYTDLCFVGSINQTMSILDRYLGYAKAMEESGMGQHIRYLEDRDFSKGPELHFSLPEANLPQVFVCNCDKTAALVVRTLQAHGLKVPVDVGVVGFDNYRAQINSTLRVFTYDHSPAQLAQLALKTLTLKLQHQTLDRSLFIEGQIVEGNSILPLAAPQSAKTAATGPVQLVSNANAMFPQMDGDTSSNLADSASGTLSTQGQMSPSAEDTAMAADAENGENGKTGETGATAEPAPRPLSELDGTSAIHMHASAESEEIVLRKPNEGTGRSHVKLQDIAQALNTSTVTVSNALSGKVGVSEEMRSKIIATAQKMGYVPRGSKKRSLGQFSPVGQISTASDLYVDSLAPLIKANTFAPEHSQAVVWNQAPRHTDSIISVVVAQRYLMVGGSFYWELYQHIISSALNYGFTTTIAIIDDQQIAQAMVPDAIRFNRPAGIIALGPLATHYLQCLSQQGIPCMQLDSFDELVRLPAVMTHNYINSYKITHHLILKGHKNIGFVGNRHGFDNITDRFYGFKRAMLESKLPVHEEWILDDRDSQTGKLLQQLSLPERLPSAFVCNCDATAYLLYSTLRSHEIKVPDDVSVVGYDNYLYGVDFANELTSINVDLKKMAQHALTSLLKIIKQQPLDQLVERLECQIIERNSVKAV